MIAGICPKCGSTNVRKDYDFPKTMRVCNNCFADYDITGEIIFDPDTLK